MKIGEQWWMAENLNTKKSADGKDIPTTNPVDLNITEELDATYQWAYEGDESIAKKHGRLYTYAAATDACPSGWHLPSKDEWTSLIDFTGDEKIAGPKLREIGNSHWEKAGSSSLEATDEFGFTALPAGGRFVVNFEQIGTTGIWWSSTEFDSKFSWFSLIYFALNNPSIYNDHKTFGYSIRCVMDK